jgi:uncharacterized protein (DUF427 family)
MGQGPFGQRPWGTFDAGVSRPRHIAYLEPTNRRVRVAFNGETVADSRGASLLYETGYLPAYYFPEADVRMDLLARSEKGRESPVLGQARSWSVRVGDRVAEDAAFAWSDPPPGAPGVSGLVTFTFGAMDEWYEEDDRILGHPADPYHRIDIRRSSRHIRLSHEGRVVAESRRPVILFETSLPPRYYLPVEDVAGELVPSQTHTRCAYKGLASYYSVRLGDTELTDLAWYYPEPDAESTGIQGYVAFFDERLDLEVDGQSQSRPETPWSRPGPTKEPMRG